MNKIELIEQIAGRTNLTKADAGRAVNAVLDTIVETVASDDDVTPLRKNLNRPYYWTLGFSLICFP